MCSGGGFTATYYRQYSGSSGGTVLPTRVYNNERPNTQTSVYDPDTQTFVNQTVNVSTFPAYDGGLLISGSGNFQASCEAPATNDESRVSIGSGGPYGGKGGGATVSSSNPDVNSGTLVTMEQVNKVVLDGGNYYAGPFSVTKTGNFFQGTVWTNSVLAGLGGAAIVTNGNSVVVEGATNNIFGAIS